MEQQRLRGPYQLLSPSQASLEFASVAAVVGATRRIQSPVGSVSKSVGKASEGEVAVAYEGGDWGTQVGVGSVGGLV